MPTVYFSAYACHVSELVEGDEIHIERFRMINKLSPSGMLSEGQAYTLDFEDPYAPSIVSVINQLSRQESGWLMKAVGAEGEELHREAAFYKKYFTQDNIEKVLGLIGASHAATRVGVQRLDGFQQALVRYENALLALQNPIPANMPGAGPRGQWEALARRDAIQAYEHLTTEYRVAMQRLAPEVMRTTNRGTAINSPKRGILLAVRNRGRKIDPRIVVSDLFQAHRLKDFARWISKVAGPLVLGTEAIFRGSKVNVVKKSDGDWHRESARQLGGFAAGAFAGGLAGSTLFSSTSIAAVKFTAGGVLAGGPIAWIILGCIAVYVVYQVTVFSGQWGENRGGDIYDKLFRSL